jgi:predicted metal-dependent HD superfamily phosphohydrolase
MTESAYVRFDRAFRALGATDVSVFGDLTNRWAEAHRHYHTARHLTECLDWVESAREALAFPEEVEIGLWFHDAVYDPRRDDSEALSAELALASCLAAGVSKARAERIRELVLATRDHATATEDDDAAYLIDIDLSILGAPPTRFWEYERQVRQEYAFVDDEAYRRGRAAVLRRFLERLAIYRTPHFSSRLESMARTNLGTALERLERSPREP